MQATQSQSPNVPAVIQLINTLQQRFVTGLAAVAQRHGEARPFTRVEWLRDDGRHGGGVRFESPSGAVFNRGSVNVSHVHYDDQPSKALASATALSTIIHPMHPLAPSIHIHLSWTELRTGQSYWRIMADLNPSNPRDTDTARFMNTLKSVGGAHFSSALTQGDRYFFIPALNRCRGVAHFYLEEFNTDDSAADRRYCESVIGAVIDEYLQILGETSLLPPATASEQRRQLEYHTLYFLQVLTLDRGTTAGLMVHDQNDIGTMGSLPAFVDRNLLQSWAAKMPAPQDILLRELIGCLPAGDPVAAINEPQKALLAKTVREFYRRFPDALHLQAQGTKVPRTVANHGA